MVVLPSSWAKADVRSLHTLRELACVERCRCDRRCSPSDIRIDTTNHVVNREQLSHHSDCLWINKNGVPFASTPGMTIKFHSADGEIISSLGQRLGFKTERVRFRGELCSAFNSEIMSTLHVRYTAETDIHLEEGMRQVQIDRSSNFYNSCLSFLEKICRRDH